MLLAVVGRADAQPGKRVAVVAAFERQQCAAAGVDHRRLQREVDRLGSTGRAEACRQRTGGQRREQPRELRPRRIRVTGIDVIGPLEAFDGFRDRRGAPPEIPDAPAHHEVDVLPAARVGDDAAVRGGNLQFRWLLSGERLAASSGHERSFPCAAMATASLSGISAFSSCAHQRDHPPATLVAPLSCAVRKEEARCPQNARSRITASRPSRMSHLRISSSAASHSRLKVLDSGSAR